MPKQNSVEAILAFITFGVFIAAMVQAPHWAQGFGAVWFLNEWRRNLEAKEEKQS
jgi:hypothetical protein